MRVKISKLQKRLDEYKEEYIDIDDLIYLSYPRINNINQVISDFESLIRRGRTDCTKSELSRKTGKSRVTIDEWIKMGVLTTKKNKIDLINSYEKLKRLSQIL